MELTSPYLKTVILHDERQHRLLQIAYHLGDNQHRLHLALEHLHVPRDEGDVKQRHEVVHELEQNEFRYPMPVIL